ncbi:MAG: hypothetical protein RQ714_05115 [Nitrosomonas sp.]|nr:hypothetical protein [Nitrosomonas sp.]
MVNKSNLVMNGLLLAWLLTGTPVSALSIQWLSMPDTATGQGNPSYSQIWCTENQAATCF